MNEPTLSPVEDSPRFNHHSINPDILLEYLNSLETMNNNLMKNYGFLNVNLSNTKRNVISKLI